ARHQILQEVAPGAAVLQTDLANRERVVTTAVAGHGLSRLLVVANVARRKITARAGLPSAACRRRRRFQLLPRRRGQPTSIERCGRISTGCAVARPPSQTG